MNALELNTHSIIIQTDGRLNKLGKLKTPDWILKGGKKPIAKKEKPAFKIRKCPQCRSDDVRVVLGEEEGKSRGEWECLKCKWTGRNVVMESVSEEEFMKYLDERGEPVA